MNSLIQSGDQWHRQPISREIYKPASHSVSVPAVCQLSERDFFQPASQSWGHSVSLGCRDWQRWTELCVNLFIPTRINLLTPHLHCLLSSPTCTQFWLPLSFSPSSYHPYQAEYTEYVPTCTPAGISLFPPHTFHLSLSLSLSLSSSFLLSPRGIVLLCFSLSQQLSFSSPVHNISRQGSRCLLKSAAQHHVCTRAWSCVCASWCAQWNVRLPPTSGAKIGKCVFLR